MKVGAAVWAAGTAIDAAFDGTAMLFASTAGAAGKMSARTGIAVEEMTALAFAAERTGGSVEGLETALLRMDRTIAGAMEGSKEAIVTLARLGVSAGALSKLAPDAAFKRLATAVAAVKNPMEQSALAQQVFGRGVLDILPLLKKGGAGIEEFEKRARDLHLTISADDVKTAREFNGMMAELTASFKRVAYEVGKIAMPALQALRAKVQPFVTQTIEWIQANRGLVLTITKVGLAVAGAGAGIVGLGLALKGLGYAAAGLKLLTPLAGVLGYLGPIQLAVLGLAGYLIYTSGVGGKALNYLGDLFGDVKDTAVESWEGIVDAVKAGDLALAGKIAFKGLELGWAEVGGNLKNSWGVLKFEFIDAVSEMVLSSKFLTSALLLWGELVDKLLNKIGLLSDEDLAKHMGNADVIRGMSDEQRKELQRMIRRKAADEMAGDRGAGQAEIDRLKAELDQLRDEARDKADRPFHAGPDFAAGPVAPFAATRAETAGTFAGYAAERLGAASSDPVLTRIAAEKTAERLKELLDFWRGA